MYVELHASSAFSFLSAASLPETLVDRAAALGYPALALLDRDGVYGAPRFHKAARAAGLRPLIGAVLTITIPDHQTGHQGRRTDHQIDHQVDHQIDHQITSSPHPKITSSPRHQLTRFSLPVLVSSSEGWRNLCRLISRMKLRAPKGEGALVLDELDGYVGGLIALPGQALLQAQRFGVGGLLDRLVGIFGRAQVYVEVQRHLQRQQEDDNEMLVCLASAFRVPVVATGGVRFASPEERPLFDVLTCIREHVSLRQAGRRISANAERYLKPPAQMARLFADLPQAVAATLDLAERLQFSMQDLGYRFPRYPVPPGETESSFLRKIADVGARNRYRPYHDRARAQVKRELDLIDKLELSGYFLIVWDIVNFCRQQDILVQGRGSAANSAVCYSLGITAVDPVGMELLFERFLSEERGEWPDIDLDLPSGDRRERVIQHVYQKYGVHGAAMTANVITYRGRSAAREVGKALDLDEAHIDRLAKAMHQFEFVDPADTLGRQLAEVGLSRDDQRVRQFVRLWQQMQDLPRHLGQHSGGMVVSQGELSSVVPLENASMPGRVVVQWDKEDCADMGIVKVDLLGLGMMAVLQDAIRLVNSRESGSGSRESEHRQEGEEPRRNMSREQGDFDSRLLTADSRLPSSDSRLPSSDSRLPASDSRLPSSDSRLPTPDSRQVLDLAHLPQDPAVYAMLQAADTVGVFQVESRAQMATLPRLKPTCFYDLVVEVALIRPGPIVGQMVHPYLNRRAGNEPVIYDHPLLEPILKRTLGVPLFQEQLLRMAMAVAGFTGGQAEDLRRAMGFKRSEKRMKQLESLLREGMAKHGITGAVADRIVLSITSFALYGFPESHAASFALIAYASGYLKVHYPAAFYTALLNNQPMGFYHPATLVKDAQRRGVRFAPIDVQISGWDCMVEEDGTIRLGLRYVSGLRAEVGKAIARQTADGTRQSGTRQPADGRVRPSLGEGGSLSGEGRRRQIETRQTEARVVCPKCGCDDASMIEGSGADSRFPTPDSRQYFCNVCSHEWSVVATLRRFRSIDELVRVVALRRDEVTALAEIGALNSFGFDRRSALWQAERAVRPPGELFEATEDSGYRQPADGSRQPAAGRRRTGEGERSWLDAEQDAPASPLEPMTETERLVADYAGTGLTLGRHPMSFRRHDLSMRGVLRAMDLPHVRAGRRVRTAGMVITRQRPGTAKGFVFLTLEDETGIANIIIRPDLYATARLVVIESPFLLVEGVLQNQEGVTSVRAERVSRLDGFADGSSVESHDFH
jgi:error-prone DNA polymerase